jgi:hypothetical protein
MKCSLHPLFPGPPQLEEKIGVHLKPIGTEDELGVLFPVINSSLCEPRRSCVFSSVKSTDVWNERDVVQLRDLGMPLISLQSCNRCRTPSFVFPCCIHMAFGHYLKLLFASSQHIFCLWNLLL